MNPSKLKARSLGKKLHEGRFTHARHIFYQDVTIEHQGHEGQFELEFVSRKEFISLGQEVMESIDHKSC